MSTATIAQLGGVSKKNKQVTQIVLDAADKAGWDVKQVFGAGGGDHADGYATDFMVYSNKEMGDWIADYLWSNRFRLGVRWIIWRQRIRSTSPGKPGTWQPMEDRGSVTQNHMDHVHVKWNTAGVGVLSQVVGRSKTYVIEKGGTLGKAAAALGVSVGAVAAFNGISNPDVVHPGQIITAPPPGYTAPAPKPTSKPAPKPTVKPKPAPKPVAKPKSNPAPKGFTPIASQKGAYLHLLKWKQNNSTSVYRYEYALAKSGRLAWQYVDGYYGTATQAATKAAYRKLGVTPNATEPGPYLLRHLGVPILR